MQQALHTVGYVEPTPVQEACIPLILAGIDLIVQSQTGTGKTAAFAIPIAEMLDGGSGVECVVLTPTRELAKQVALEFERLAQYKSVEATAVYGGVGMEPQIQAMRRAQVVVATPGRLLDHLRQGHLDFKRLKLFVLDEADEMLSMGFEKELNAIVDYLPKAKQSLLFSATVGEDIKRLAGHFLTCPEYVSLSSDGVAAASVEHIYFAVTGRQHFRDLEALIELYEPDSALIFCNTRDDTVMVHRNLVRQGHKAEIINGDLPQKERERALDAVKDGRVRFLVATDVAARGIDISVLPYVINYTMPDSADVYVHRTGRTGRAGRQGIALTLLLPQQIGTYYQLKTIYKLELVERSIPTREEIIALREQRLLGRLVQQLGENRASTCYGAYSGLAEHLLSRDDAAVVVARLLTFFEDSCRQKPGRSVEASVPAKKVDGEAVAEAVLPLVADAVAETSPAWEEVSINLGRQQLGDRSLRDVVTLLAGLFPEDVGAISLEEERATVAVKHGYGADLVAAMHGQRWRNITLVVEVIG